MNLYLFQNFDALIKYMQIPKYFEDKKKNNTTFFYFR